MKSESAEMGIDFRNELHQDAIIARLVEEKIETEVDYFREGAEFGYGWAQYSHFIEIQYTKTSQSFTVLLMNGLMSMDYQRQS